MPFKSEKQRKYLWANEPEIARDWTDTYGSKIHKADGGAIAGGNQIGERRGNRTGFRNPHEETARAGNKPGYGPGPDRGGGDAPHLRRQTVFTPKVKPKVEPKGDGWISQGISYLKNKQKKSILKSADRNKVLAMKKMGLMKGWNPFSDEEDWSKNMSDVDLRTMASDIQGIKDYGQATYNPNLNPSKKGSGSELLGRVSELKGDPTQATYDRLFPGPDKPTDGGGEGQIPWWLRQQAPVAAVDDTTTTASTSNLGSGHYQVPIAQVYNQTRAADGGRIGYQMGNMVGAEMEGAEMKGAMMQSQEVIKELYDALIAQGLSPQEAMEKIKQMIASSQTQEPQSPMMGEEFPGQEFGRAPAAFGGIMDTYTGRRKYGFGSFISKAFKKVKKLASSKVGKLALMYAAGTYLGGTQALSGQAGGMGTFAQRLKNPKLLANFLKPQQWGTAGATTGATTNAATMANAKIQDAARNKSLLSKGLGWIKENPTTAILGGSLGAGLYTAKMPVEELDDVQGEWDEDKAKFDAYLASLDTGDSYRVPENLRLAQGGRIGRQEGGLMNLGGMEKDYRNDGGFVPLGGEEKADDVPARLSKNEFVFTADAVRNAGGGDIDRGAEVMENVMKNLEGGGQISEESQGQGAQEMFETSERLSEVI